MTVDSHETPLARLGRLGLTLPPPPAPAASYVPSRREGRLVFVAGQLPFVDGKLTSTGLLGREIDTECGIALARLAALNALAVADHEVGGMDRLGVAHMMVFVASAPDYFDHHLVANGASELFIAVLGDRGRHTRTAIAVPCLPLNGPVEVQVQFVVDDGAGDPAGGDVRGAGA